ncbi:soluble P-type ATPase [Lachnospiraceae bacterium JC7]|nr:soluble P-type ATPase [Lachnospiraceae bacterium JC7]
MIQIDIPGRFTLCIEHLVLDYNGTVAEDGSLIDGVEERLMKLKELVSVHILTADTYGTVREQCKHLGVSIDTFEVGDAAGCKAEIVRSLNGNTMCVGNGYNDAPMLDEANLSVCVLGKEGTFAGLLSHADIVTLSITDALDLLTHTDRIRATLRG